MTNSISKISNAFSTGGGGTNFEQQIQAMFLLSLMIEGFCPAMNEQTKRVCFQAKRLGYDVDDIAIFTSRNQTEGKMLCQIKHSITVTENDKIFKEVICAAWSDFNKENFDQDNDRIALATARISNKALRSLRFLHEEAVGSVDEEEFNERINTPVFSNAENPKMLKVIKNNILSVKGYEPTIEELWKFCKVFIILLFDMDCVESVNRALSASLIRCNSSMDALLVWAKLVEYAGMCNQSAASIDKGNIDKNIQELFFEKKTIQIPPAPIVGIDLFVPTIALIGGWNEENEFDRKVVEKMSGMKYQEFQAKARALLLQNNEYLQISNGVWRVCHKEELLDQCKKEIFDDSVDALLECAKDVLSQKSKCATSKIPYYVPASGEYDNSQELRNNLVKSLCWIKKNLSELVQCNVDKIKDEFSYLVKNLLEDADWMVWVSLRECLQYLAELSPDVFLNELEKKIINKSEDILRLFPSESGGLLGGTNYISNLLWSLEILAWSPEYFLRSVSVLGMMEALPYKRTNWTNTRINSIVSILLPWYPQTMANFEKRKIALKCLKKDNPIIFWNTLKKLLPNNTCSTSDNPKPQYLQINIPEKVKVTKKEIYECYTYLLELAVETSGGDKERLTELVDQMRYMNERTLNKYLAYIKDCVESDTEENTFRLWLKLRESLIRTRPVKEMAMHKQEDGICKLIKEMEPKDIRWKYRELYLGNRYLFDKGEYKTRWERLENEKQNAIKEIFDEYGIEEVEQFGFAVKNVRDVANKLGRFLTQKEMSSIIEKYSSRKLSRELTINCLASFVYSQGAEKLLETSLCRMEEEFVLDILSEITFSLKLFEVIKQILKDDDVYWKKATMRYGYPKEDAEELKIVIEKLTECGRYVTAVNIIGHSEFEEILDVECVYNLLKLAGTEESIGNELFDDYAVQKIIGWFQKQNNIDLERGSDIEFIYLPMLGDYSEVQPLALNTRLSIDPDYFCYMIKMFYKKRTDEKSEKELNKGQSDRLFEILFQFKITPGIDWNGNFDEERFEYWMKSVKRWSKNNDRYEVTMHTVGSGLSYAALGEDKLPQQIIIEELNKIENDELRRGYYLGIINQRGVHFIDPEGKPELELARDYRERANTVESRGYSRYADLLRTITDGYEKEAKHNMAKIENRNIN